MRKYLLIILIVGMLSYSCNAQESAVAQTMGQTTATHTQKDCTTQYGLKTNLLSWATLAPNLEFDIFTRKHWNYAIGGGYGWWGFTGDQHALQSWKLAAESRYYFRTDEFRGSALGLRAETGQFDVRLKEHGRRGQMSVVGLTYTYTWRLGKHEKWYFDAGFGAGYIHQDYTKYLPYKPTQCYHRIYDKKRDTFGLTHAFLNIGYRFPIDKQK